MNKKLFFLSLILFICACTLLESFKLDELEALESIDKVEVFLDDYPNSHIVKTIDNPEQVDSIVRTFRMYADGWRNYIPTPPHAPLQINFYSGDKFRFGIGIGYSDQTSSGKRIFYLSQYIGREGRPLTKNEFEQLIQALGVEENLARHK